MTRVICVSLLHLDYEVVCKGAGVVASPLLEKTVCGPG